VLTFEYAVTSVIITNSAVMWWGPRIARSASWAVRRPPRT
jgi:hypothetical protein